MYIWFISFPQCGPTSGCEMDCEAHEVRPPSLLFPHDHSLRFTDKFIQWKITRSQFCISSFLSGCICTNPSYIVRSYSRYSLTLVLPVQDLLCYLIDDGGFLIMSNQIQDWNKVRRKLLIFRSHAGLKHTFRGFHFHKYPSALFRDFKSTERFLRPHCIPLFSRYRSACSSVRWTQL